ncbi:MAG TPA: hypothetical protein VHM94_05535 [Acidimicrobiia bacterium]|nr:hypothetical protein [Acidimicrobiia bacterium]
MNVTAIGSGLNDQRRVPIPDACPGLGIIHPTTAVETLALDLKESVRPDVDRWLLDVLLTPGP